MPDAGTGLAWKRDAETAAPSRVRKAPPGRPARTGGAAELRGCLPPRARQPLPSPLSLYQCPKQGLQPLSS